jgi:hypothetical protein
MSGALPPIDPIADAFRRWVEETDPIEQWSGIDIACWIHVVKTFAPRELTIAEINAAGRKAWGDSWFTLSDPPPTTKEPF